MPTDAASIMTTKVVTVRPDDTVARIAKLLATHRISAVPVCDATGQLLGMLSEGDLMRPLTTETETRRTWWLRMLAEGTQLAPEFLTYLGQDKRRAGDLMTREVISVTEATPVRAIADLIMKHRVKRVPVLRDGKVVGIVSRADLVTLLADAPEALVEPL